MSLPVGIPKELKRGERRVSLTPQGVRFLHEQAVTIYIEENAGLLSGFSNEEYKRAGGILVHDAATLWEKARLIKKVKEPIESEFQFFSSQHIIFTYLHLASPSAEPLILALQKSKTTAIAYETIEKNGETPLLTPMSEVAGTLVAYYGAIFKKHITISGNKIVGIEKAKVLMEEFAADYTSKSQIATPAEKHGGLAMTNVRFLILGGGHVGKCAAQMAAQMGGDIWISEISEAKRKQLRNYFKPNEPRMFGRGSINIIDPSNLKQYHECLASADVIIGAVHSAGKRAPLVIDQELLKKISSVKPKIILDVSIDQGGNIAESRPTDYETPLELDSFGNLRFSVTNIPSFCGRGASVALEAASLEYTRQLAQGLECAVQISPELKTGINVLKGEVVHPAVSEAHDL